MRRPWPIAAIVLAAGSSERMGESNKLLEQVDGHPLLAWVIDEILASAITNIFVVTGFEHKRVETALDDYPITPLYNPDFSTGIASSIRTGITNLPEGIGGVMVFLGDMPLISRNLIGELILRFDPPAGRSIIVPTYRGRRGNPILWSRDLFDKMRNLKGDRGARTLFKQHKKLIYELPVMTQSIIKDVDTPDGLAAIGEQLKARKRGDGKTSGSA